MFRQGLFERSFLFLERLRSELHLQGRVTSNLDLHISIRFHDDSIFLLHLKSQSIVHFISFQKPFRRTYESSLTFQDKSFSSHLSVLLHYSKGSKGIY